MALYVTVFAGTAPIGGLLAGALAQAFGAPVAFSVGAAFGRCRARARRLAAASDGRRRPELSRRTAPVALELDRRAA